MIKVFDIKYKDSNKNFPKELELNFEQYEWNDKIPIGFGNLNSKIYLAIKEITGCESISCRLDLNYKKS